MTHRYQALLDDIAHLHAAGVPDAVSPLRSMLADAHRAIVALENALDLSNNVIEMLKKELPQINIEGLV